MTGHRKKILYLMQLPPPVHGVSTINSVIYNSDEINRDLDKFLVEIKSSDNLEELRKISLSKLKRFLRLRKRLKTAISGIRPDLVYFSFMPVGTGLWRDLALVRILKRSGIRIIYHIHNRGVAKSARNPFLKAVYRYVFADSVIIHLSGDLIRQEILPLGVKNATTHVVQNGYSGTGSPGTPEKDDESTRLLYVSNLFPSKGIYDLVEIMSCLRARGITATLSIVGGAMRKRYERILMKKVEKQGLGDCVFILGPKYGEELNREYRTSDIFVFPSKFKQECAPLVLLEAMQCGLPVVASRIGAIPEIISDGKHGLIAEPGNIREFTDQIERLITRKTEREAMGKAARKKYESTCTVRHFEEKLGKILARHLQGK